MEEDFILEFNEAFSKKGFLTLKDISEFLGCSENAIINWTKRSEASKRPPRVIVGSAYVFPKRAFARWLAKNQLAVGSSNSN